MERTKGNAQAMRGLQLLEDITKAINESGDLPSAFRLALRKICEATGWTYGEVWMPNPDRTVLECCYAWHRKSKSLEGFQEATQRFTFQRGVGLPGRVWVRKRPEWLPDISAAPAQRFPRVQSALKSGLKAVFGVPLISDREVLAIFIFFLSTSRKEDKEAVAMVSAVANHLGSFIQRKRAEEALQRANDELEVKVRRRTEELEHANEKLRALTGQLISAREEEAKRLARELHDAFGQRLAVLNMKVSELGGILPSQPALAAEKLRQVGQEIGGVAKDVHQLSRRLHPAVLSQLGLEIALESECAAYSQQHGIRVDFSSTDIPELLSDDIALCFFRVAQECLQNIRKHSHAKRACVSLTQRDHEIVLRVQDFGKGFDLDGIRGRAGLGLVSMEERVRLANGTMSVRSQPGRGTQIEVRIPVGRS